MRWLIRVLLVLVVVLGVAVIAAGVLLPRWVNSPKVTETLRELSVAMIGRPADYENISAALFPLRLVVSGPSMAGADPTRPDFLRADEVSLHVALLPLLTGTVVFDSLEVKGFRANLVRTPEGIELPSPQKDDEAIADGASNPGTAESEFAEESRAEASILLRRIHVHDGVATLLDTTLSPAQTFVIDSIGLDARGDLFGRSMTVEGSGRSSGGGRLELRGLLTLADGIEAVLALEDVEIADFMIYAHPLAGGNASLSGQVVATGPISGVDELSADLTLSTRMLEVGGARVSGPVAIRTELEGDFGEPAGDLTIDLTGAEVVHGDVLHKAPGVELSARGTYRIRKGVPAALKLERLAFRNLEATLDAELGDVTRLRVSAPPFDIEGWGDSVPPIAPLGLRGPVALRDLSLQLAPLDIRGELGLDLLMGVPGGGDVRATGAIRGLGDSVQSSDLDLAMADQHVRLNARLDHLNSDRTFRIKAVSAGVLRANPVVTTLTGHADLVEGPLILDADIAGILNPASGSTEILDTFVGALGIHLGQGAGDGKERARIKGFSVLEELNQELEQLENNKKLNLGLIGLSLPDLDEYTSDEFDRLDFECEIAGGVLRTKQARILYRSYALHVDGDMQLADTSLDMEGSIELSAGLMSTFGLDSQQDPMSLPLADIRGTAQDPKVTVSKDAALSFVGQMLLRNKNVSKIVDQADEILPGAGDLLGKGLDGLLGGGKAKAKQ